MNEQIKGKLILEKISEGADEEKIIDYLSGFFKKIPKEKFAEIIKKTPITLAKNIPENTARVSTIMNSNFLVQKAKIKKLKLAQRHLFVRILSFLYVV